MLSACSDEDPPNSLRGMYSYMADAGWFVECRSGVRMPVAQEGDNAALESAYSKAREMPGAPMLATVNGRVEERLPMEGAMRPTLIVDKFISVEAQGCSGPSSTAELENTYWKLMTLGGTPAESPEGAREIHFVLNRAGLRISGFSGCNQMTGSYQLDGGKITFSNLAGTMMACPTSLTIDNRIHEMFSKVAGWKISGETLQLTDASDTPIATFESRYL
jgi:copper homeostasis protein (lipoprotein)